MTASLTLSKISQNVGDYLREKNTSPPIRDFRAELDNRFLKRGRVAIVGGLVRDLAWGGWRAYRSDVDLAIEASVEAVADLAAELGARPNRFGGFRYERSRLKIDFWALWNTWAHTSGHVNIHSFKDLPRCTFFDTDAVVCVINAKKSPAGAYVRRTYAAPNYAERLSKRLIEINLRPNPSPEGNLLRACRRIIRWNLTPGPALRDFIDDGMDGAALARISAVEATLHADRIVGDFKDPVYLKAILFEPDLRAGLSARFAPQLELFGLGSE